MKKAWQLQEAKNRFSEVVEEALRRGPQLITRRGEEIVVVISVKEYKKMMKPAIGLLEFFQNSPARGVELDLERNKDGGREIEL